MAAVETSPGDSGQRDAPPAASPAPVGLLAGDPMSLGLPRAAAVGQSAVACVFGVFAGFWLSCAVLVLGLTRNWFGIAAADVASTEELFLTAWLIAIVLLTLATLRLPLAFTGALVLVDLALLFVLLGTANNSAGLLKVGGVVALVFAALGAYIFVGAAAQATGGSGVPLGRPVLH